MSDQPKALEHEPVGPANEPDLVNTAGVSGSEALLVNLFQFVKQVKEEQQKVSEALLENQQKVMEALHNQQKVSEALLDNQKKDANDIKEMLKAEPEKISISQVSWDQACQILDELEIDIEDGNTTDPLEMDNIKFPDFSMANFGGEEAATPAALEYIQQCLQMHSVTFGRGGFILYDMHKEKHLDKLFIRNQLFQGGVDGVLVPYGVARLRPQRQVRAAIELKHSQKHKALYAEKTHGIPLSGEPQGTTLSGTVRGQAILEAVAGLVRTEHPEIMLLVTDIEFNALIKYEAGTFIIWENISFNQAIHKLAKFLNSCNADRKYRLAHAMLSMSEDAATALVPTVELRKKLRPNNSLLLEQLESVLHPDMSFNESLATAMQLIQAHRPCNFECSTSNDSWKSMFS